MAKKVAKKKSAKPAVKFGGSKTVFLKRAYAGIYGGTQVKVFNTLKAVSRTTTVVEDDKTITNKTEIVQPDPFYTACQEFSSAWTKITGQALPENKTVEVTLTWK